MKNFKNGKSTSKPNYKRRGSSKKFSDTEELTTSGLEKNKNDVSWYVPDPQILKDVASLPYSYPVGYPFSRDGKFTQFPSPELYDDAVPGIATMLLCPTIGNAKTAGDPVNVAANGMYTFVRHLNSGARNYDANDLMIYCMAVDALYYMVSWMTRLYGTVRMYSQANRYLPRDLVDAQRVDFDDLMNNIAQFRAGLNLRIPRIATLLVPNVLPIFIRHSWLFSNYFIEGDSEKDQIYQFAPDCTYVFGYDAQGAGMLNCVPIAAYTGGGSGARLTVSQLFNILDDMMDPIIDDEDFNIISGDIYKAYSGNVMTLALVPEEYNVQLTYNAEVLLQFKNAKMYGVAYAYGGTKYYHNHWFDITQGGANKDHLVTNTDIEAIEMLHRMPQNSWFRFWVNSGNTELENMGGCFWNEVSKDVLLTTPHAVVDPSENMINTRLTPAFDLENDTSATGLAAVKVNNIFFGTEWPNMLNLTFRHRVKATGVISTHAYTLHRCNFISILDPDIPDVTRSWWPIISAYKYLPEMAILVEEDATGLCKTAGRSVFELDNYTLLSNNVIGRLHDAAIMGEYNVPKIALFPTSSGRK